MGIKQMVRLVDQDPIRDSTLSMPYRLTQILQVFMPIRRVGQLLHRQALPQHGVDAECLPMTITVTHSNEWAFLHVGVIP